MRGFFANGAFPEAKMFGPAQFIPIYSMQRFDKHIPEQFCTFTVIRPTGILYPKGYTQVRKFFMLFTYGRGMSMGTRAAVGITSKRYGKLVLRGEDVSFVSLPVYESLVDNHVLGSIEETTPR